MYILFTLNFKKFLTKALTSWTLLSNLHTELSWCVCFKTVAVNWRIDLFIKFFVRFT